MDDEKKNITVSFLIGAAIGAGVAYFVSDTGRKKTPDLYNFIKKSLEDIADDPQKSMHRVESEVMDKAEDLKDTVSDTIESIKTIGSLNIDKLLPRDIEQSNDQQVAKLPSSDESFTPIPQDPIDPPKKPKRFFKRK